MFRRYIKQKKDIPKEGRQHPLCDISIRVKRNRLLTLPNYAWSILAERIVRLS